MNEIKGSISLSRDAIKIARKSNTQYNDIRHISNYYRLQVDNNSSFLSTETPSHITKYQKSEVHKNIMDTQDDFESADNELVREVIHQYRDWSYLYGFKERENSSSEINISVYGDKDTEELLEEMNHRIRSSNVTVQDAFLSLRLCYIAFREVESERFDTTEEFMSMVDLISEQVENLVNSRRENTNIPYDWNAIGASLDYTEKQLLRRTSEERNQS